MPRIRRRSRKKKADSSNLKQKKALIEAERAAEARKRAYVVIEPEDPSVVYFCDVILLHITKRDGNRCFLAGDGVVSQDVVVVENRADDPGSVGDVRDCQFRLVPGLMYTAYKEFRKHAPPDGPVRQLLLEKLKQEERDNEVRKASRSKVRMGDTVQLVHVMSGKYVTALPKCMGQRGRGTHRVAFTDGVPSSRFTVLPFYKHKTIGDPMTYGVQVVFAATKPSNAWRMIAAVDEERLNLGASDNRRAFEVHCATDNDSVGFNPIRYDGLEGELRIGHVVRIFCPQSDYRVLGASCAGTKRPFWAYREAQRPGVVDKCWGKGVWVLEARERLLGGVISWAKKEQNQYDQNTAVCVRHLGTGMYLSVDSEQIIEEGHRRKCLTKLQAVPNECSFFWLEPLVKSSEGKVPLLAHSVRCMLLYEDCWGPLWLSYDDHLTKKPTDDSIHPNLQSFWGSERHLSHSIIIDVLDLSKPQFVLDLCFVKSWRESLRKSVATFQVPQERRSAATMLKRSSTVMDLMRHTQQNNFETVDRTVSSIIRFLTDAPDHADPLRCPRQCNVVRQRLVKELKLIDASMALMDVLKAQGIEVTQLTAPTAVRLETLEGRQPPPHESELDLREMRCLRLLVELWRCSFQDLRSNELYFFKRGWMEKMNELNGLDLGCARTLQTLVGSNLEILKSVGLPVLQRFCDFISLLGPDATWLHFMQAVCSCNGNAISDKQQTVLQLMYHPGEYATEEQKEKWGNNRFQLLLSLKVSDKTKCPLPTTIKVPAGTAAANLPGYSLLQQGIRDLQVSWNTCPQTWDIGKSWLYFHPIHLELSVLEQERPPGPMWASRNWISLADLTWVLDPEYCYALVHPSEPSDAWEEQGHKISQKGTFKARLILAKYFVAQIDLMREMCLNYQVNCVHALQKEYSFEALCCALWDCSLAPTARRAFVELLITLWVERHPHMEVQTAPLVFVWNDVLRSKPGRVWIPVFELDLAWLDQDAYSAKNFDTFTSPQKFQVLTDYVKHHLVSTQGRLVHSNKSPTLYTASVVKLLLGLLKYGFIYSENQLAGVLNPLLACLDGRTDLLTGGLPKPEGEAIRTRSRSGFMLNRECTDDIPLSAVSASSSQLPLLWNDGARNSRDVHMTNSSDPASPTNSMPTDMQRPLQNLPSGGLAGPYPDTDNGATRYVVSGGTEVVEAKVIMCEICSKVLEIAVGNGTAQLVRLFAEWQANRGENEIVENMTRQEVLAVIQSMRPRAFDLSYIAGTSFNVILMDLMMYENPKLFVIACKVMRQWNSRLSDVVERAADVCLLSDHSESKLFHDMKADVSKLANFINTSEDWAVANSHSPLDMRKFKDAEKLLEHLRQLCSEDPKRDTEIPAVQVQSMLENLRLGQELVRAYDMPKDPGGVLPDFMSLISKLLYTFVSGHTRNQQALFGHLKTLMVWNDTGERSDIGVANAIAGIFRGNHRLCEKVPEELIYQVGRALVHYRKKGSGFFPQRLDFLRSILVSGKRPVVRNKSIVLDMLRHPRYDLVLHLMNGEGSEMDRRDWLLTNFRSWPQYDKPPIVRVWAKGDDELQYHNRCWELCALLCAGRDQSGADYFVQSKIPPYTLVASYSRVHAVHSSGGITQDCHLMCCVLKRTMLICLLNVYYDTAVVDTVFYGSIEHWALLGDILEDLDRLKALVDAGVSPRRQEEELLCSILRTLTALLEFSNQSQWHPDISVLLKLKLQPVLYDILEMEHDPMQLIDTKRFKALVARCFSFLMQDRTSMILRTPAEAMKQGGTQDGTQVAAAVQDKTDLMQSFTSFVAGLRSSPDMQEAMAEERTTLTRDVCKLYDHTNPTDENYIKERDHALFGGKPIPGGFRRNAVSTERFLLRCVSHCLSAEHLTDWDTTQFVIFMLSEVLISCQRTGPKELQVMQELIANGGGTQLCVDVLCGRPVLETVKHTLTLAGLLLRPNNKVVQRAFTDYFHKVDDVDLWNLFKEMLEAVSMNIRPVRILKRIVQNAPPGRLREEILTTEECATLDSFSESVRSLEYAMQFLQLMCEGHNAQMQAYCFCQTDNSGSTNFIEKTVQLVLRLCKNEAAADCCDEEDIACMTMCFELLVEATTRPEPTNQDFIAGAGLVQGAEKIISARWAYMRRQNGDDAYPEPIRSLKNQVSLLLVVLLELRKDNFELHRNISEFINPMVILLRLVFVHRWFLSREDFMGQGDQSDTGGYGPRPHLCCSEGSPSEATCWLDDPMQDDGLEVPDLPAEELIAGYQEEDLIDLFGEAFNLMVFLEELKGHNTNFKEKLEPTVPKMDTSLVYRASAEFVNEIQNHIRLMTKYRAAYQFFEGWINLVEIVMEGVVYEMRFRIPVICGYVQPVEKAAILNEVPFDSSEEKLQRFINMCAELYDMSIHRRDLSQWSPLFLSSFRSCTRSNRPLRPLLFFLKNDSQNLNRISYIGLMLAAILNLVLFQSLVINPDKKAPLSVMYASLALEYGINSGGCVYLAMMTLSLVLTCLTYSPVDHARICEQVKNNEARLTETLVVAVGAPLIFLAPVVFSKHHTVGPGFLVIAWLYQAGMYWQKDWMSCPNNSFARFVNTLYSGLNRQAIFRRLSLVICCLNALFRVEYFYTFLLLDMIYMSPKLQNVIKAVTLPLSALAYTSMLGLVMLYEYAAIAFFYFREDFGGTCEQLHICVIYAIQGMRADGGLGGNLVEVTPKDTEHDQYNGRFAYDLSFFVLISTVFMNILFGIIVDTFGQLRENSTRRELYFRNISVIACLDRATLDRVATSEEITTREGLPVSGFKWLNEDRQNCWNYMNFVFYLYRKDPINYTGPETVMMKLVRDEDISWLPLLQCKMLQDIQFRKERLGLTADPGMALR